MDLFSLEELRGVRSPGPDVDDMWCFPGHVVALSQGRRTLWHRVAQESVPFATLRVFSCSVVSLHFVVVGGVLKVQRGACLPCAWLSEVAQLLVGTSDGYAHWWDWLPGGAVWTLSATLLCCARLASVCYSHESAALVCLEVIDDLECAVTLMASPARVLARVAADAASAALYVEERHAWVHSRYGGLTCVKLGETAGAFPPTLLSGALLAQHPTTRQLASLHLVSARLELLRPFREPLLLCTLAADCAAVTQFCFLHQCAVTLDQTRCGVFDAGTGQALRVFTTVAPQLRLSLPGGRGIPPVLLWGPPSAPLHALRHGSVSRVAASLPPQRGARMAEDWGLNKLAAWRMLDAGDAVHLMRYTATPALSVALAADADETPPELVQLVDRYLHRAPDMDETSAAREAFQRFHSLTPTVAPLLRDWLRTHEHGATAAATMAPGAWEHLDDAERMAILAVDEPAAALAALQQPAPPQAPDDWRFPIYCRLLAQLQPEPFGEWVAQLPAAAAQVAWSCTALRAASPPRPPVLAGTPLQVLRKARAYGEDTTLTVGDVARFFDAAEWDPQTIK